MVTVFQAPVRRSPLVLDANRLAVTHAEAEAITQRSQPLRLPLPLNHVRFRICVRFQGEKNLPVFV